MGGSRDCEPHQLRQEDCSPDGPSSCSVNSAAPSGSTTCATAASWNGLWLVFYHARAYIPNIFAALLIIFLATLLGRFLAGIVRGVSGSDTLAKLTYWAILIYAIFMALMQLHIAQQLTGPTFLIILGGIALAGGLAFGLGGRDQAKNAIERFTRSTDTSTPGQPSDTGYQQ